MSAGAAAFASLSDEVDGLLSICEDVAKGKMVFPFLDVRQLQKDPIQQFSRRERSILEALSKGSINRELSLELGI
jgi:two-component system nitrate/nitrite response regulator NarP